MIQIGSDKVVKVMQGSQILFENDGWKPIKLGPNIKGSVLYKLDRDNSQILLSGTAQIVKSPTTDDDWIILYSGDDFEFSELKGYTSFNGSQQSFGGGGLLIALGVTSGNLVSTNIGTRTFPVVFPLCAGNNGSGPLTFSVNLK